jgi:hypothetical protein
MTIKEYLSQALLLDHMIQGKILLSEDLNRQAMQCGIGASPGSAGIYAHLSALEAEINADIDRLVALKQKLYALIEGIPDLRERTLLELRYLSSENGKRLTWAQIAQILCYDERWVMRLHLRALKSAEKVWKQLDEK